MSTIYRLSDRSPGTQPVKEPVFPCFFFNASRWKYGDDKNEAWQRWDDPLCGGWKSFDYTHWTDGPRPDVPPDTTACEINDPRRVPIESGPATAHITPQTKTAGSGQTRGVDENAANGGMSPNAGACIDASTRADGGSTRPPASSLPAPVEVAQIAGELARDVMINFYPGFPTRDKSADTEAISKHIAARLAALVEENAALRTQLADARRELEELRHFHDGSVTEAYRLLGIENDGELRMKWVLLEIAKLKRELEGAREDGARLDWLENNKQSGGGAFRLQWSFRDDNNQKSLRSAIDSARAAETGREGT